MHSSKRHNDMLNQVVPVIEVIAPPVQAPRTQVKLGRVVAHIHRVHYPTLRGVGGEWDLLADSAQCTPVEHDDRDDRRDELAAVAPEYEQRHLWVGKIILIVRRTYYKQELAYCNKMARYQRHRQ